MLDLKAELAKDSNIIDAETQENFALKIKNGNNDFRFNHTTIKTFCKITNHNKIYVVLSAVGYQRDRYPIFFRVSWHPFFEGITLFMDDPTRDELKMSPSFYFGTKENNCLEYIKKIVGNIQNTYKIQNKDITFISSSNGGFASLYLANEFEYSRCIALCPQLDIKLFLGLNGFENFKSKVGILNSADEEIEKNRLNVYRIAKNSYTKFFIYSNIAAVSDRNQIENFCNDIGFKYHLGLNQVSDNFYLLITQFDNIDPHVVQPDENFVTYVDNFFWDDSPERKKIQINSYMNLLKKFNECDFRYKIIGDLFSVVDSSKVIIKRNINPLSIDVIFSKDMFVRFSKITDTEVMFPSIRFNKLIVKDKIEKIVQYTEVNNLFFAQSENWANVYSKAPISKLQFSQWFVNFITTCGFDINLIKNE